MNVMFDTNIFSDIVNDQIPIDALIGKIAIYATHIQYDELNATKDHHTAPNGAPLRQALVGYFNFLTEVKPTESYMVGVSQIGGAKITRSVVPTESSVWDISDWDQGWGNSANLYEAIWQKLEDRKSKPNNRQDALIAETAIINGYVLVTHDGNLLEVTKELQGDAISLDELMQEVEQKEAATV